MSQALRPQVAPGADDRLRELGVLPATVTTQCRASDAKGGCTEHPITLAADWTLDTGHDLAAERLAAALGARVSCLDLVDRVIPAARHWLRMQLRLDPPPITSRNGRRWTVKPAVRCCSPSFDTPAEAAEHARSDQHAAARFQAPARQLAVFVQHWTPLLAQSRQAPDDALGWELWHHGFSPDYVRGIERQLLATQPTPLELHLAILARQPDLTWVGPAAAQLATRNPAAAVRLVWDSSHWQRIPMPDRTAWLAQPIPLRLALTLARAGIMCDELHDLADSQTASLAWAAAQLAAWLHIGIRLNVADWQRLARAARSFPPPPSRAAIDRARQLHPVLRRYTDKQVALALAEHGHAHAAAIACR